MSNKRLEYALIMLLIGVILALVFSFLDFGAKLAMFGSNRSHPGQQ
jgi:hypothetical protein